jgi:putative ABC transport system permease protein
MKTNMQDNLARSSRALDAWWLDVKLGMRMLIKYPGLALVGGFGIAVAVAIATGGFSVIYGTYLASLPLDEGERLVSIELWDAAANQPERRILHDYQVWRGELKSVQELGAFRTFMPNLIVEGAQPESVRVASMTGSGLGVARVAPLTGRYLTEDDEREGAPAVVVIGERIWRSRFAADPAILGRALQLGATRYSVVGVMPESFAFPVNHQLWVPLRVSAPLTPLTGPELMVFGRLAPGATPEQAQAELATVVRRTALAFPKIYARLQPQALPYPHPFLGMHGTQDVTGLHLMQGIVTTLLVLVCLNVAILVYTRTAMRQSEIAVRSALGASRGRIVAQLFIEALVLSAAGALTGIGIAALALRYAGLATLSIAQELPFWLSFQLSPGAVLYAVVLSVLAAAIVGVVPALKATRRDVQAGLTTTGAGGSGMKMGKTWTILIVAQVGFAVALLPAAVFNAWGTIRSGIADPGFAAGEFLSAELGMDGIAEEGTRLYAARQSELMRRLEAEPQVSGVTFAMKDPGDEPGASIETEDARQADAHAVRFNRVDISFFRTFDVPILAGRDFGSADLAPTGNGGQPEGTSVVVNQTFAQRVFGGNSLGRRIRYAGKGREPGPWYEIIGIVSDFPSGVSPGMDDSPLKVYHPIAAGQAQPVSIAVRVKGGAPSTYAGRLRELAAAVDPELRLRSVLGMEEVLRKEQWIRRMEAGVLTAVTLTVLMLSSAGIYALMAFTVSQRRREIGIRIALGADRRRIVSSIFARAFGQLAAGAALGMAFAAALERASGNMRGNEVFVLPAVAVVMIAIGFFAALGPARRSLRIQPTEALREQ